MYPVSFKRRLWLHLALASLLVGTPVFLPQLAFLGNWAGYVLGPPYFGGFGYLVWQGELLRPWNREKQVHRTARTLELRGLWIMWGGYLPILFDLMYFALFRSYYPYRHLGQSVGASLVLVGTILLGIGLLMDWRDFPREVDQSAHRALIMMKDAGFELDDARLWIGIDSAIRALGYGYSYSADDGYVILVSPASIYSLEAGGLGQTLVHEMSHVYLWQKKHPSHLSETSKETYDQTREVYHRKWQLSIVRSALNYPAEVFTEELTFRTLTDAKNDWAKAALEYFRRLSRRRRVVSDSRGRGRWKNALLVLRNCYYSAEMEKYQMQDPEGIVKKTNERLLSSLPPVASAAFDHFHQVFMSLSDNITAEDYKKTLEDYLSKFISLAEGKDDYDG